MVCMKEKLQVKTIFQLYDIYASASLFLILANITQTHHHTIMNVTASFYIVACFHTK
jgi:hypothetical protein